MTKLYLFLLTSIFSVSINAQIINFPDANFKAKLLEASPTNTIAYSSNNSAYHAIAIDTNSDGEIDVSEAAQVAKLNVDSSNISSLAGIENFTNMFNLYCNYNELVTLDFSGFVNLGGIYCSHNALTSLILPADYVILDCSYNSLTSLILPNSQQTYGITVLCDHNNLTSLALPDDLRSLYCSYNQITTLSILAPIDIHEFDISYNQISELNIENMDHISFLNISGNLYTSIAGLHGDFMNFNCNDTQLIALDCSHVHFGGDGVSIANNLNLQYVNFRNGYYDATSNHPLEYTFYMTNNPAPVSICDDGDGTDLSSYLNNPNITYTSYCDFTPAGSNFNTVTGTLTFDADANGCDSSDAAGAVTRISLTQGLANSGAVFTNPNGGYTSYQGLTSLTYTPQIENPYFTISPTSFTPVFSTYGQTQNVDFCITPNGTHNDLELNWFSGPARPGFDAHYTLIYKNKGTAPQSGIVSFGFDDSVLDFVNANPVSDLQSTGNLS